MKRSTDSLDTEYPRNTLRRHNRPSCELCKRKKLKCDREAPCSNCKSRNVVCSSASGILPVKSNTLGISLHEWRLLLVTDSRRESWLKAWVGHAQDFLAEGLLIAYSVAATEEESVETRLAKLEALVDTSGRVKAAAKSVSPKHQQADLESKDDIEMSERLSAVESSLFQPLSSDIQVGTSDYAIYDDFAASLLAIIAPCKTSLDIKDVLRILPPSSCTSSLLENYSQQIGWIFPVIHPPTFESHVENVYANLENGQKPDLGHLAIVATVFALSAYYFTSSGKLPFDAHEARTYAFLWFNLARSTLRTTNFIVMPTIETIQSVILLSHHLLLGTGAIEVNKILLSAALQSCRTLKFHLIDSTANRENREENKLEGIDHASLEIKRRIWWHVASTDCKWTESSSAL